jgi:hypothetical protein
MASYPQDPLAGSKTIDHFLESIAWKPGMGFCPSGAKDKDTGIHATVSFSLQLTERGCFRSERHDWPLEGFISPSVKKCGWRE